MKLYYKGKVIAEKFVISIFNLMNIYLKTYFYYLKNKKRKYISKANKLKYGMK